MIWFDEIGGGNTTQYVPPLIVISRLVVGSAYDSILTYSHSSGLKSLEEFLCMRQVEGSWATQLRRARIT